MLVVIIELIQLHVMHAAHSQRLADKQAKIAPIDETKLVEICNQIVIDDDKIKVYDGTNLRVQLGNLA